ATVDATGKVTGVTITNPGSGYTSANPPMVTFTAPTSGVTATGTATVADTAGLFNSSLLAASGSVTLNIGTNVFISGSMAFSKGGTVTATLSDGSTKQLSLLTVGASSVDIFLGANGPATNANAEGVSLTGGTFGLALLTPTDS